MDQFGIFRDDCQNGLEGFGREEDPYLTFEYYGDDIKSATMMDGYC